ncbi:MAG: hypothetical protein ABI036_09810 [Fibrobacteria bacterium]
MKKPALAILSGLIFLGGMGAPVCAAIRLLAITPNGEAFMQALEGLKSDLGDKYEVRRFDAALPDAADSLRNVVRTFTPQGLILMDSKAIVLAKALEKDSAAFAHIPKFVTMTLKAEGAIQGLENVAGIKFEVPAYTIFINLRILSRRDFRKVGVFYRQSFSAFVEESRKFLAKENIDLAGECMDCGGEGKLPPGAVSGKLRESMERLASQRTDVIWMLADNTLVNETTLKGFWLTHFKEYGLPVVVPLPNLASLELNLGMFGVWPDYRQLGMQAAQQIIQVFESGETPGKLGLEPLVSVQTVINLDMAQKVKWDLNKDKLYRVNSVLTRK